MAAENRGSSSSSSYKHEVFLSFRGDDTGTNFTDHLYAALCRDDIRTFRDKEGLEQGQDLVELFKRIEESRVSIPVFSENYANSTRCLMELTKIMECKKIRGQVVLPIFYKVKQSQVRKQTGSFEKAFLDLEEKHRSETVGKWRDALTEAANLSGWDSQDSQYIYETELIDSVVKEVLSVLGTAIFEVAEHPMGIDSQVQEVLELLDEESNEVKFVGIHGMGGIGKTAIAMAVWNKIVFHFQSWSFLENFEGGNLADLQNKLVTDISKEKDMCNRIVAGGITAIKRTCHNKKVLIILDDMDDRDQLSALAGGREWFGGGSRIIITTRDKQILSLESKIYMPKLLDANQSLQLFSYHAFERDQPPQDFKEISEKVVSIAGGLPLALKAFGSILRNTGPEVWKSTLERLKHIPNDQVHNTLKRSIEGLNQDDRGIFLDIACFFIGMDEETVIHILEGSFPRSRIDSLVHKSLVNIDDDNQLVMHDQLRDMGRELIRQEDPKKPERRSRVWSHEEALDVLKNCKGTSNVEGLLLNFGYESKNCFLRIEAFKTVPDLRLLQVDHANLRGDSEHFPRRLKWLSWKGIIRKLPTISHLEELVVLDMSHSMIEEDWNGWRQIQMIKMLKVLDLSGCINLTRTPDLSSLTNLERLILDNCTGLIECHETIGNLKKLVFLSLKCCKSLTKLPDSICKLSSVECLILTGCQMLCKLPEKMGSMESLTEFIIDDTAIEKLPDTIGSLLQLQRLSARNCEALSKLPHSMRNLRRLQYFNLTGTGILDFPENFGMLTSLEELEMAHCRKFEGFTSSFVNLGRLSTLVASHCNLGTIPLKFGRLFSLKFLDLSHNKFDSLPASFICLSQLQTLELQCCTRLQSLPPLPSSLIKLNAKDCMSLKRLPDMSNLKFLKELCLEGCENLANIDGGIRVSQLKKLPVTKCPQLQSLPVLPSSLIELEATGCDSLERLPDLSNLKKLQELRLLDCMKLSEIQGISGLSLLQKLELENCGMLEHLPELPPSLTALDAIGCNSMERLPNPLNLKKLQALNICSCMKLSDVQGISGLSVLQKLGIENCGMLKYLPELPQSLIRLDIRDCLSIERLPDLSNLKKLKELHVEECEKLAEIPGLESLESLIDLQVCECHTYINTLRKNVAKSEPPNAFDIEQIRSEYQIYDDTSGKGLCFVYELTEAPTSSSPGEENVSLEAEIKRNDGKIIKCVHDLKVEGTMMANTTQDQFYSCYFEGLTWFGFPLKNGDKIKVTPTSNQRITIKMFDLVMAYEEDDPTAAANLSGWDSQDSQYIYETKLIGSVVKEALSVSETAIFEVAKHPVGIDFQVQEVLELLDEESDDVKFVGIHGMGGIGKTTIAMAVWNKIVFHFQSWSFLENVRGRNLADLQNILVTDISKEKDMCNRIVAGGITAIKRTCHNKKVLIILDDVDDRDQLSALAGGREWFGGGSRIIITTRDKQILSLESKIYMPKLLDANQSLQLFSYHAFERDQPPQDFKELSEKVVPIAGGLPLALKAFGSFLRNKGPTVWKSTLERLKHIPDDQVHDTLKRSIEGLNQDDRETFLDIACFFVGMDKETVIHILEGSFPGSRIDSLVHKSLVNIDDDNQLVMHDQLRYMGRELIRQEDPKKPERRSRVWSHEEALDVLKNCKGTSNVEGLLLNFRYKSKNCFLRIEAFKAVPDLRLLQVDHAYLGGDSDHFPRRLKWLSWKGISSELPTISHLEELVVLDMSHSMINEDWNGWRQIQMIKMLKALDLSGCINLTRTPDLSSLANLERLILDNCTGLIACHETIGNLKTLVFLSLKCCKSLTELPDSICELSSVESLILTGCKMLYKLPETMGSMKSLTEFIIDDTAIEKLPDTIGSLLQLKRLSARNCEALSKLPLSMRNLRCLQYFNLTGTGILDFPEGFGEILSLEELQMAHCQNFTGFPSDFVNLGRLSNLVASHCNLGTIPNKFGRLFSLKFLDLSHNKFVSLPASFRGLSQLQTLELQCCTQLRSLRQLPASLIKLNTRDCTSLEGLPDMSNLKILKELCLEGCENLANIDDGIRVSQLKKLAVIKCTQLHSLPELPSSLIELEATVCDSLKRLPDLSNLKILQALRLRHCMKLSEIQGISGLSLLQKLELENCGMLQHLPELPPSLTALDAIGCNSMERLPNPLNLKKLQALNICSCMKLSDVQGISGLSVLQKLGIENCGMLENLPELPRSLISLDIRGCSSIGRLPDLSNLKKLKELHVEECEKLAEIPGLKSLESLIDLQVCECHTYINTLPKNVAKSEPPNAFDIDQIRSEYQIYYDTSGMGLRFVYELTEAPTSSSPGEENVSLEAEIKRNDGKIIKCVHDLKVEGTMMANTTQDQFYSCYFEGLTWFGFPLKNGDKIKVTPTSNQRITIKMFDLVMAYEEDDPTAAANLSGWDSQDSQYIYETKLIGSVVKEALSVSETAIFEVAKHPVGIDFQVQEVLELLDEESDDVKFVGIHGMGGIGKTTIAMAVWNKIVFHFQSWSFLENVRGRNLADLQNILVTDISKEKDMCNRIVAGGITAIKRTCHNKKVLIILDDVDDRDQLSALAGGREWFGGGSRIIITTRDKQILSLESKIYMPKLLDANQSLQLFSYHAFERDQPPQDFKELSEKVVPIAGGLPLALKAFGSFLRNKGPTVWKSTLERLKHIPDDQVHDTLKRSIEGLNQDDRETFLDIACFFVGMDKETVIHILEGSFPGSRIDSLVHKSLVNIDDDNQLVMHDQLRYMGRELIRQEDPKKPERRSRVWSHEEALDVLKNCKGTSNVEGLLLNFGYKSKNCFLRIEAFKAVPDLRLLQVDHAYLGGDSDHFPRRLKWLSWKGISSELPTISHLEELVVLDMSHSMINEDWNGWRQIQMIKMLKALDLSGCINLTRTPDLSSLANLERLILDNCTGLIACHETIGNLKTLVFLSLKCCKSLTELPDSICELSSVESLILTGCKMLYKLPETMGSMKSLTEFIIDDTAIEKLPDTIGSLLQLKRLSARNCEALSKLPLSMRNLRCLQYFNLTGTGILDFPEGFGEILSLEELQMAHCQNFTGFPSDFVNLGRLSNLVASHCNLGTIPNKFGRLFSLKFLDLSHNKFVSLPASFRGLSQLQTLELQCCTQLRSLRQLPASLIKLNTRDCTSLEGLPDMSNLKILKELCLEGCENLANIDDGIRVSQLKKLAVIKCTQLHSLPELPSSLIELEATVCDSLKRLPDLSNLKILQALRLRHCMKLSEIQGISGLSLLQKLELENCGMLQHLPELPPSLTALDAIGCNSMERLPNPLNLKKLQALNICSCMKLSDVQGISGLSVLQKLGIENCGMLENLPELPWSLISLDIRGCSSIGRLPDLSNLKKLKELHVEECEKLAEIPGLKSLESLIDLQVCECHTYINTLPKNVAKSEPPNAFDIDQIRSEYQIYYDTSGMGLRFVYELTEAPTSSSPGEENVSLEAEIKRNDGKIIKCVHDLKVEGTMMANTTQDQFYSCYFEGLTWFGFPLKNGDKIKVTPTSNQRITIKMFDLVMEYEEDDQQLENRVVDLINSEQC